ncbi:hypothetical protein [Glaciecola petra]|uniref:Uncharacterized protein n=1 Tax=Glaciecola petra TaxID=3075602 RepID=A0ABU2ZSI4_9ALTE|nr:hypothetical protein [Aestuariibacter sp. P117]MDT0595591.1 hypothetical protein [Aestuariibacter sp. P117]
MPTREYYIGKEKPKNKLTTSSKSLYILGVIFVVLGVASALFLYKIEMNNQNLQKELNRVEQLNESKESELAILRTLNPYQFKYKQILGSSEIVRDLMPGWIARVYQAPKKISELATMMDMGAFVLDQSKFTLSSHESYGLDTPENALYRLNGLVPASVSGRFQVGMRLAFTLPNVRRAEMETKQASCFARVDVNNKRVIEKKIRFLAGKKEKQLLTGDVMVQEGIHPISALIYCDEDSVYSGQDVQISLTFRDPGSRAFKTSSESVFHLYKQSKS